MIIAILGGYLVGVFAAVVKPCVPWKQWLGKTPTYLQGRLRETEVFCVIMKIGDRRAMRRVNSKTLEHRR